MNYERNEFKPYISEPATEAVRGRLGIATGTGTLVTLKMIRGKPIPSFDTFYEKTKQLVAIREIITNPARRISVRNLENKKEQHLTLTTERTKESLKQTFNIPGYPGAKAKLVISRAKKQFPKEQNRFRRGGILVKSSHAIHQSTYFESQLENDEHAAWFYGRVTCEHIDRLWTDYDNLLEQGKEFPPSNPEPIYDPSRRAGLVRSHPFTKALFKECLKRFRPLVEQERRRAAGQQATIENRNTRKRLDKLQQAAAKFMDAERGDDDLDRDPNANRVSTTLRNLGYTLSPPYKQLVKGDQCRCWLKVRQEAFPEIAPGTVVQIEAQTNEIALNRRSAPLEPHQTEHGVLQAVWMVTAERVTSATSIIATTESIRAEAAFEIFATLKDQYSYIKTLEFSSKRYIVNAEGSRKKVSVRCPIQDAPKTTQLFVSSSSKKFKLVGQKLLTPKPEKGIAEGSFRVSVSDAGVVATLTAQFGTLSADCELVSELPKGAGVTIKITDEDFVNQRHRWRQNVLEISARHKSLKRYLGPESTNFEGQDTPHFRLLIAEIVADAVCGKLIEARENALEYEDEQMDWNLYYSEYSRLMSKFLPIAHELQF